MRRDSNGYSMNYNALPHPPIQKAPMSTEELWTACLDSLRRSREMRAEARGITVEELEALELQFAYGELDDEFKF